MITLTAVVSVMFFAASAARADTNADLLMAAKAGDSAAVEALLAKKADVNAKDAVAGSTALMAAASEGNSYIVRRLIAAGADVGARDYEGRTAMQYATRGGHTYVAEILRAAGAGGAALMEGEGAAASGEAVEGEAPPAATGEAGRGDELAELKDRAEDLAKQKRFPEAIGLEKKVLEMEKSSRGPSDPEVAKSMDRLGGFYLATGNEMKAEELFRQALAIKEKSLGHDHPTTAVTLNNLGGMYLKQEKFDMAEEYYGDALVVREKTLGADHPLTAETMESLGTLYRIKGDKKNAERLFRAALAVNEKVYGPDHPKTRTSAVRLAALYDSMGIYEKAEPLHKELHMSEGPAARRALHPYRFLLYKALVVLGYVGLCVLCLYIFMKAGALGDVLGLRGATREAAKAFDAKRNYYMALLEERRKKYTPASLHYEKALILDPRNRQARFNLSRLYLRRLGDKVSARQHLTALMKQLPTEHAYHKEAAEMLAEIGDEG